MHSLLARQLRKLGCTASQLPTEEQFSELLALISRTYKSADDDRARLERSLDVSSREMLERTQEIQHLAFHDKLTGLPNRALFLDRIEFALAKARRNQLTTAVLFVDLDNFKLINDSLGHEAGDELLKGVADRLSSSVRVGDTVARLGGDEFTVLIEDLKHVEDAERIARDILASLKTPFILGEGEAFASVSIGIAFTVDPCIVPSTLIKNADTAMYNAKARGKSCISVYDACMVVHAVDRLELETFLRQALQRNEITVAYQPLVSIRTGRTVGAEALARWTHPIRGIVPPSLFIPIAEEIGAIVPIGYRVLEAACRQMVGWHEETGQEGLALSVNLSGKQLLRKDVVDRVRDILKRTALPPSCLKLEITETVLMSDREDIVAKMHQLKQLGVRLALDDFGTGYSSLSMLSAFPIDTLKIDRAFISRLESATEARAIVEAIMALSRSMRMDVTSEGVETDFQMQFIRDLGCDTGQGYLFAKPLSAEEFGDRLGGDQVDPSFLVLAESQAA